MTKAKGENNAGLQDAWTTATQPPSPARIEQRSK